jgi:general secretion pathway protein N
LLVGKERVLMRTTRWVMMTLIGLATAIATAIWFAPAALVDVALDRATAGRLRMANASGTFWQGRGRMVLVDTLANVNTSNERTDDGTVVQGLVLPGDVQWSISRLPLFIGMLEATLRLDGMAAPLRLNGRVDELRGSAGSLNLASIELSRLGSPWNTIRPSGLISLRWNDFTIKRSVFEGKMTIEIKDASSVMTPVQPLGSYQVDIESSGAKADLKLITLAGPLNLTGTGVWTSQRGVSFSAEANPDASEKERLQAFLALVGRRQGDKIIIKIGA